MKHKLAGVYISLFQILREEFEWERPKTYARLHESSSLIRIALSLNYDQTCHDIRRYLLEMKKGAHPQMQWISYVTQSGRLMNVMMTKIHHVGKVYHFRAKRQMAESLGQVAKFKRRYEQQQQENVENNEK
ncbi:hypothetical protein JRO89_XS15G0165700 [Xanthoceras sorbifolium]|uniref:Uncharacterized protein n=1 Tax=Xanthoceras sorbifolium TaxID=99658 RepID=A0ABQ8H2J1_9ROSI|nr:hypothetical protein JRO89_XS15G0165700 [Xanthoceras sorbifolium]